MSEIKLTHKKLADLDVTYAYGEGSFHGLPALALVTESPTRQEGHDPRQGRRAQRRTDPGGRGPEQIPAHRPLSTACGSTPGREKRGEDGAFGDAGGGTRTPDTRIMIPD